MTVLQALAGRVLLAGVLGARRVRRRPQVVVPVPERVGAAVLALAVPGAAGVRTHTSGAGPATRSGRVLLAVHVLSGAVLEELVWRAPLTTGTRRARRAVVSAACFVAIHVRRDGRSSAPVHLAVATAWTVSALLGRGIGWNCVGHAAYNYLAITGRPR